MPLYEYICNDCEKRFTFLHGNVQDSGEAQCPRCKSKSLRKLISRVRHLRGDDAMLEDLADPTKIGDIEDPKEMRRWAKKMGKELGAEMGEDLTEEFEEMIEAEARGELDDMDGSPGGMGGGADDAIY